MGSAEDRSVFGDKLQYLFDLGAQLAVVVSHPDSLGLAPAALLGVVAARAAVDLGVIARVYRGHPHLLASEPQRCLDGGRINAAYVVIEDNPTEDSDVRDYSLHQVGPGHRALVMAFEQDGPHARVAGGPHDVEVVRQPREAVREWVAVQVDRTGHVNERPAVRALRHTTPPGAADGWSQVRIRRSATRRASSS